MNNRIKELAERATVKYDRLGNEIPFAQPDLQVFAELIVNDCISTLYDDEQLTDALSSRNFKRINMLIKEKLGVR